MLKKLRGKFIIINMSLVITILIIVLGNFYHANLWRLERQTEMALMQAQDSARFNGKPNKVEPGRRTDDTPPPFVPTAVITLSKDGQTVTDVTTNNLSVSDDMAATLADLVMENGDPRGVLKDYSLRYNRSETPDSITIAFADQSFELNNIRALRLNCLLLFFIAAILFLLLSIFLSRWALKPVEQAWKQQNQFIADASHELKTPLTVILANLQILLSHQDSSIKSQIKWVDNTKEEASRMKQLVEELLFLARSDAGTVEVTHTANTEFDYSDSVLNCVLLFESVAFENKVTLNNDIVPGIHICGSEPQIKQVVTILLDNACKYAGIRGTVSVSLKSSPHHAVLTVNNTGEPIPPSDQKHIFERFYRTDKSRVRKEDGYGLGLSIARTIVEQHKGKITVSSSLEEGTTFTVMFPVP